MLPSPDKPPTQYRPMTIRSNRPGDVLSDGRVCDGHHRYGRVGGEPVGLVVAAGVVADAVQVTEHERHRAETLHAGAGEP